MNTSGEAADQVVRMSLEVGEAALKISGTGIPDFRQCLQKPKLEKSARLSSRI